MILRAGAILILRAVAAERTGLHGGLILPRPVSRLPEFIGEPSALATRMQGLNCLAYPALPEVLSPFKRVAGIRNVTR